jgi:hypothetical protein
MARCSIASYCSTPATPLMGVGPPSRQVHATQVGGCLCSCGQLRHGAAAVTRGVRYVLIAFLDDQQLPPDDSDDDEDDEEKGEQESVAGQGVPEGEAAQGVTGGLSEHTQLLSSHGR